MKQVYKSTKRFENNKMNTEETINLKKEGFQETKEQNPYEKNKEMSRINNNHYEEKKQHTNISNNSFKTSNNQNKQSVEILEPPKKSKQEEIKEIIKREILKTQNNADRKTEIVNDNTINNKNYDKSNDYKNNQKEEKTDLTTLKKQQELTKELNEYYNIKNIEKNNKISEIKNKGQMNFDKEKTSTKTSEEEQKYSPKDIDPQVKELLNSVSIPINTATQKSSSEKYLEEVSRKLAKAETIDEVERTDYELEQEENAIISYKELMSKKDSIQTIDEEEAVISIEELMNRKKTKEDSKPKLDETSKLYKLTEEEENDDFIKELKQFRNDL